MKKYIVSILMLSIFSTGVLGFDLDLLKNDKEIESRILKEELLVSTKLKLENQFDKEELNEKLNYVLSKSIEKILDYDRICDQRISKEIFRGLDYVNLPNSKSQILEYLIYLRANNTIDDIFYRILKNNTELYFQIENESLTNKNVRLKRVSKDVRNLETSEEFKNLYPKWPNARTRCPVKESKSVDRHLRTILKKDSYKKVKSKTDDFYMSALKNKDIDHITYNKLMLLREHDTNEWPVSLNRYLSILRYSKNKLTDELDYLKNSTEDVQESLVLDKPTRKFLRKYKDRALKMTKREYLYKKYNDEQIILLADVLIKASKRMNAYESKITIQYREEDLPEEFETYVISPMEQYRMSLKMLKKDMNNLSLSKLFKGRKVSYDDIIMASYETGVFGQEELEYVIKFEEFWNPKTPTWKIITKYVFGFAGTASFYLPPPWNIVGAIGLVFTETQIFKRNRKANAKKNSNSIF